MKSRCFIAIRQISNRRHLDRPISSSAPPDMTSIARPTSVLLQIEMETPQERSFDRLSIEQGLHSGWCKMGESDIA